ncbi:hypothetical protein PCCS19_09660 [Paenibacillus sp. CCS19]|uniref:winged helix-turn-helix domain-containing protein n=1 Tax=Paenibacillus sp. CCS19 TaxID=3158387 RepID=UPI00256D743B|nr:winged helix-turn-helix domain-containing protein [Paenibacillus cellulosilyticus]GMK37912.1 hypothetical protein PCCS19_09660 [Paenibacillus cellulosilyticus]
MSSMEHKTESEQDDRLRELVTITYAENMELVYMMYKLANLPRLCELAEQLSFDMNTNETHLMEQASQALTPHQRRELAFFFEGPVVHSGMEYGFIHTVLQDTEQTDINSWVSRIEAVPGQEIVEQMVFGACSNQLEELFQGDSWSNLFTDKEKLRSRLESLKFSEEQDQVRCSLLECIDNPEEAKERYLALFRQFYMRAFQPIELLLKSIADAAIERYEIAFEENPSAFITQCLRLDPSCIDKPVKIHVSVSSQVGSAFYAGSMPEDWAVIGIYNDTYFGAAAVTEKLEKLFKALSDKKRLEFMLLLKQRQRFGKELAEELGITPGAVTYHAGFLLAANLIEIYKSENRHYYRIHTDQVIAQLNEAIRLLAGRSREGHSYDK